MGLFIDAKDNGILESELARNYEKVRAASNKCQDDSSSPV